MPLSDAIISDVKINIIPRDHTMHLMQQLSEGIIDIAGVRENGLDEIAAYLLVQGDVLREVPMSKNQSMYHTFELFIDEMNSDHFLWLGEQTQPGKSLQKVHLIEFDAEEHNDGYENGVAFGNAKPLMTLKI